MFRRSHLVLTDKALYRKVEVKGKEPERILITREPEDIIKLFDIDLKDVEGLGDEDSYAHLAASPYFNTRIFIEGKDGQSIELDKFKAFLMNHPPELIPDTIHCEPIRTETIEKVCGIELRSKIDDIKSVLMSPTELKFKEMKALLLKEGYVPQDFSKDLPGFKNSFKTKFEYRRFTMDKSPREIADYYLKLKK